MCQRKEIWIGAAASGAAARKEKATGVKRFTFIADVSSIPRTGTDRRRESPEIT
jgi:hypothetical protein